MPYAWYGQKPGLRMAAFGEPYPDPPKAYPVQARS
jgi:hypothetical protein